MDLAYMWVIADAVIVLVQSHKSLIMDAPEAEVTKLVCDR